MKRKTLLALFCGGLLIAVLGSVVYNSSSQGSLPFNLSERDGNFATLEFKNETTSPAQAVASTPQNLQPAIALQNAYNNIAKSAIPAVVSLQVEGASASSKQQFFGNEEFLKRFFGFEETPKNSTQSFGSGFIISRDGYLISNYHVIKGAKKISIFFNKGNENASYTAEVVGTDPDTDIALLKIKEKGSFPYLSMGNSDLAQIGDIVIAIGNPFNLSHTFTTGVISAIGRSGIANSKYENYLQTDVAINPGNSGGPLISLAGEVIGINSVIISRGGGNIGIGFSIPINMVKNIVSELKETGTVTRGWIGIHYNMLDAEVAKALKLEKSGILISKVVPNSPASKSGLKSGDIITRFNKKYILKAADLLNQIATIEVGKKIAVEYYRNGKKRQGSITLQKQKSTVAQNPTTPDNNFNKKVEDKTFGIVVKDMDREFLKLNKVSVPFGVVVEEISPQSALYKGGVRASDVIEAINYKPIKTTKQFNSMMQSFKKGENVFFKISREGFVSYVVTTL